jgi:hypothetical protein
MYLPMTFDDPLAALTSQPVYANDFYLSQSYRTNENSSVQSFS